MSLAVEGLTVSLERRRGAVTVVEDVSLVISSGEAMGLVGESGAGKSLLCRAVAGLLDPPAFVASGRVLLNGNRIDNLDGRRMRGVWGRELSLLLQGAGECLNPMVTVGAQLEETLAVHGSGITALDWLDRVGLPDPRAQARAYPHQLSGGMKQRAALALALCSSPRVLLADEPTSALDPISRQVVLQLLLSLCRAQATTLLLVTHDLLVARACDRVGVLYAGKLVECGPAGSLLRMPVHPYTQALIACLPRLGERQPQLPVIGGALPAPGDPSRHRGCVFAPRCKVVEERCAGEAPPMARAGETDYACWRMARSR